MALHFFRLSPVDVALLGFRGGTLVEGLSLRELAET
jgi:hypothetical protein